MKWPEKPTCHASAPHIPGMPPDSWEPAEDSPNGRPFRSCSYCGSIHPEDLAAALQTGAIPEQADWKYGYPHKLYIEGIPNPRAGEACDVGKNSDGTPIMGTGPATVFTKWYNDHLMDSGYDTEAFEFLTERLKKSGVHFYRENGEIMYKRCPV